SLTITARRRPLAFSSTCRTSVVFPAPRKPVMMVHGTLASVLMKAPPQLRQRHSCSSQALLAAGGGIGKSFDDLAVQQMAVDEAIDAALVATAVDGSFRPHVNDRSQTAGAKAAGLCAHHAFAHRAQLEAFLLVAQMPPHDGSAGRATRAPHTDQDSSLLRRHH